MSSSMSAKELKAKQKQLEKLQLQLRTKESQLDKREKKLADRERAAAQLESRLESDSKQIARDKKMLAQAKKKGAAAAAKSSRSRDDGGGLGAGSSRKIAQLEAELKKAKADAAAKGRDAKKHYQTILDLQQRIKVLERQVQNLKKKGKGKGNNKALKNARKEIRQLKKKLKQLLRELAKKRRWFQRVIKQFKTDRANWARKQKEALADKRVMVRYIFLDDVKKISVYKRGKDQNKFLKRCRVSLDSDDKASVVVKDIQIVYVQDDGDEDDDGADGGSAMADGSGRKKKRKKPKKTDAELAAEEDTLEQYLADMFPRDYAAATATDHGDEPVDYDEELEAMLAVSSEEDSEDEAAAKKKKKRGKKKKGGADGDQKTDGGDEEESEDEDEDDDELGLGGTDDASELKGQIEELGKDAKAKNDELNKIRWLILRAGQPGGAEGVANDTAPIPSVAQALQGDVPPALAAGYMSGSEEAKSEDNPDGSAGDGLSLSFWTMGLGTGLSGGASAAGAGGGAAADGYEAKSEAAAEDGDEEDGAEADSDGSGAAAVGAGAGADGGAGASGLTPMAALVSCIASKAALDQAFEDMKANQDKRMASLDSWNFDFSETPMKEVGSDFNQLFLNLSRDALNSKTAYARLMVSIETYMKELIGRIGDLTTLNKIIYDPQGEFADPDQRQQALNEALEAVETRHAQIAADFDQIAETSGDAEGSNDTTELVGGIKVKQAMIENNEGWLAEFGNTDQNWGVASQQQQKLIDRLSKFLQDVKALPTVKLPEVSLDDGNAEDDADEAGDAPEEAAEEPAEQEDAAPEEDEEEEEESV